MVTYLSRNTCSGIHPVNTHKSVPELEPGKSYPPRTFKYAFSSNAGHNKRGLFRSRTCKQRSVFEEGRRSSIVTFLEHPLKFRRKRYFPFSEMRGRPFDLSKGYIIEESNYAYLVE